MTQPHPEQKIGKAMLFIGWLIALGALTYFFGNWEQKEYNPNQQLNNIGSGNTVTITLERNRYNHYVASGKINGIPVTYMLDTGATHVAIPAALGKKLNLKRGRQGIATTANGEVNVWQTNINTLELGPIKLNDVRASLNPGMSGNEILLGMSVLKHLEFTQSGNTLTIKQYL